MKKKNPSSSEQDQLNKQLVVRRKIIKTKRIIWLKFYSLPKANQIIFILAAKIIQASLVDSQFSLEL